MKYKANSNKVNFYKSLFFCIFILLASSCSGRVTSESYKAHVADEDLTPLISLARESHEDYKELVTALNLARLYQLQGMWKDSIWAFNEALVILEEYENRAIINIRGITKEIGTFLLAKGSSSYYGAGYERSLLHTFNALNYLMLGNYSGAAVEMRKMEVRQELWLQESAARVEEHIKDIKNKEFYKSFQTESLPEEYAMRSMLANPSIQALLNNYQDSFSYSLSSILCRLAKDPLYAEISMQRAIALDPSAKEMFAANWAKKIKGKENFYIPPLPKNVTDFVTYNFKDNSQNGVDDKAPLLEYEGYIEDENQIDATLPVKVTLQNDNLKDQEITVIVFTGLTPSLKVEQIRIFFPVIGYAKIELPGYEPPIQVPPPLLLYNGENVALHRLLNTEFLAYRTLMDEVRMEIASAFSRALFRAGVSASAYAIAKSNENTSEYAGAISLATTLLMDLFSQPFISSVRNWELLPNKGYITMGKIPNGSTITLLAGDLEEKISLPKEALGGIIIANLLPNNKLRVHYVAY